MLERCWVVLGGSTASPKLLTSYAIQLQPQLQHFFMSKVYVRTLFNSTHIIFKSRGTPKMGFSRFPGSTPLGTLIITLTSRPALNKRPSSVLIAVAAAELRQNWSYMLTDDTFNTISS